MKTLIIEEVPIRHYEDDFEMEGWEFAPYYQGSFFKPKWNGTDYYESASVDELQEQQQAQALEQAKQFLNNNKTIGEEYYNDINLQITVSLFAIERSVLFPILEEVNSLMYPPLDKIRIGDFASALFIFLNQQPPTNQFVLNFYNEAVVFCQNYYDTKYPK